MPNPMRPGTFDQMYRELDKVFYAKVRAHEALNRGHVEGVQAEVDNLLFAAMALSGLLHGSWLPKERLPH